MQICSFLWVYYGYPACEYEGKNVEEMRFHTGFEMGKKDDIEADFVSGIPDSGVGMALGYAVGKQIPYRRGIVKYTPTWPRSFTPFQSSHARAGSQNETHTQQKHARREAGRILRRLHRPR